jgi:hypothetical protein
MDNHVIDNLSTRIIVLNSLDRDWFNDTNSSPFNFEVSFTSMNASNIAVIEESFKNITSIEIPSFIISNSLQDDYYHSNAHIRPTNNPYLLVEIDDIIESSRGTNKYLDASMGIFTPSDIVSETTNDIKNIEYRNTGDIKKIYLPTPIPTLSDLKVKIRDNKGTILPINDVIGVNGIYVNNEPLLNNGSDALIVRTGTFFTENEFIGKDNVMFKNYNYHNMSYSESYQYENFINREEGHKVIAISKSNSGTSLYDQISIQIPASYSRATGNIAVEPWFTSFMEKSLGATYVSSNGGKLINMNKQCHLVIKLDIKEKMLI